MLVVGIGLGANLGDRAGNLTRAIDALAHTTGLRLIAVSPIYETEPVGPPQPRYLNGATRIETTLAPLALLDALLGIELALGRVRQDGERWGPRTIDLDVLVLLEPATLALVEVDTPGLRVPHPRLLERAFALAPLIDVFPELADRWGPILADLGGPPPRARG